MRSRHTRIIMIAAGILSAAGVGGCSVTPLAPQASALSAALSQFEATVAASPVPTAQATLTQARMLEAAYDGSIEPLVTACDTPVRQLQQQYIDGVTENMSAPTLDGRYEALLGAAPCGPRSPVSSPAASQLASSHGVPRVAAPGSPAGATPGSTASSPVALQALVSDLKSYFSALDAITAAKDAQSFDTAAQALSASVTSVAKATGTSETTQAVPALFSQLAQTAVQEAEYGILRLYVPEMDSLLTQAEPSITTALRMQQSFYITVVTMDAHEGMGILNGLYEKVAKKNDSATTLTVYAASAPIIADFGAEQASVRADPEAALNALIAAHHALAQALKSNRGELPVIVSSVTAISAGAESLMSAPAAASPSGSSHTAASAKHGE